MFSSLVFVFVGSVVSFWKKGLSQLKQQRSPKLMNDLEKTYFENWLIGSFWDLRDKSCTSQRLSACHCVNSLQETLQLSSLCTWLTFVLLVAIPSHVPRALSTLWPSYGISVWNFAARVIILCVWSAAVWRTQLPFARNLRLQLYICAAPSPKKENYQEKTTLS